MRDEVGGAAAFLIFFFLGTAALGRVSHDQSTNKKKSEITHSGLSTKTANEEIGALGFDAGAAVGS
jgi:hypothetical protein